MGFNKSKPNFFSMAVHAEASTTILLCVRKGSLSITRVQIPGAMIAWTDVEDQSADGSCNCNLMYSVN